MVTSDPNGGHLAAVFTEDHLRLDEILRDAVGALLTLELARAAECFSRFSEEIRAHIAAEDSAIFPPFEARSGLFSAEPTVVMRREHALIDAALERIGELIAAANSAAALAEIKELGVLLRDHTRREERILYSLCDRLLSDAERARAMEELQKLRIR
jgi:iron-sulfur cluster repair protein YtfE (RIC family)